MEDREDRLICAPCGVEFSEAEAAQADHRCPHCGAALVAKEQAGEEHAAPGPRGPGLIFAVIVVLLGLAGIIFLLRSGRVADLGGLPGGSAKERAIAEIIGKALEINGQTPLMVDKSTRLDRVVVAGTTIISKATLINFSAENTGEDLFKGEIGSFLAGQYCKKDQSRQAMALGIKYGHEYYGSDGALLYTATISDDDCSLNP
jgi:DNA-directed RNA polymerase subunit RPC12/RpoP